MISVVEEPPCRRQRNRKHFLPILVVSPVNREPLCWKNRGKPRTERERAASGSTENMILLEKEMFLMGTEIAEGFPADGEGPIRKVLVDAFHIDKYPVTNGAFAEFVAATAYKTDAERFEWSFVFQGHIPAERYSSIVADTALAAPWWCKVRGADWQRPEGPDSNVAARPHHPVVHVSWNDARAYAQWPANVCRRKRSGSMRRAAGWSRSFIPGEMN